MVKKSQMKIQQTAFMLIAITLFFVLVGLFALGFKISDLNRGASNLEEKNAMLLVSRLAGSPEFSCGDSFGAEKISCVDADKAMVLKGEIEKYRDFWGVSDIRIRKIYPKMDEEVICTSSNYPNCNIIKIVSDREIGAYQSSFVSLCRKESVEGSYYNKCELARLMVSYEVVE